MHWECSSLLEHLLSMYVQDHGFMSNNTLQERKMKKQNKNSSMELEGLKTWHLQAGDTAESTGWFYRTWVQFPAPMWLLTTMCHFQPCRIQHLHMTQTYIQAEHLSIHGK